MQNIRRAGSAYEIKKAGIGSTPVPVSLLCNYVLFYIKRKSLPFRERKTFRGGVFYRISE